jgi:hypothetical protein
MTSRIAWTTLVVIGAVCVEVWCGRLGLLVAAWPLTTLYLGVALGSRWGAWAGMCACVIGEVLLVRSWTSLPLVAVALPLAIFWRRHGDRRYLIIQMLPAGLLGFVYAGYALTVENWVDSGPLFAAPQAALVMAAGTAASGLGAPALWRLLDPIAGLAGLPRFYQAQGLAEIAADEEAA